MQAQRRRSFAQRNKWLANLNQAAKQYKAELNRETARMLSEFQKRRAGKVIANLATRAYLNPQTPLGRARVLREFAEFNALQKGKPTRDTDNQTRPLARNLVQRALSKAVTANNRRPKPKKNAKMPRLPYKMWAQ